jgi:hypothetical protein
VGNLLQTPRYISGSTGTLGSEGCEVLIVEPRLRIKIYNLPLKNASGPKRVVIPKN